MSNYIHSKLEAKKAERQSKGFESLSQEELAKRLQDINNVVPSNVHGEKKAKEVGVHNIGTMGTPKLNKIKFDLFKESKKLSKKPSDLEQLSQSLEA